MFRTLLCVGMVAWLAGCSPDYSPDTYASAAVQQANKVEQGVVIGRRVVEVSPDGSTGAVAGAAAGGIAGSQVGTGVTQAFGALGGGLVGGAMGVAVEKTAGKTIAYEYVVRESDKDKDLFSVTQQDVKPLEIGQKVLVITGKQARIVPDYTVAIDPAPPADKTDATAKPPPVTQAPLPTPGTQTETPAPGAPAVSPPAEAQAPSPSGATPAAAPSPPEAPPASTAPAAAATQPPPPAATQAPPPQAAQTPPTPLAPPAAPAR